jgi:hypothetical protein
MDDEQRAMEQFKSVETPLRQLPPPPTRSSAFDFMLPFAEHPVTMDTGNNGEQQGYHTGQHGYPSNPPYDFQLQQHPYTAQQGTSFQPPPPTSFLGDPSVFLADENLLELMKWGASSMGPDMGTGLWPFPGDTPSSHGAGGSATRPF